ncbi:uncharacterized protein [Blastocystis hominis]|uniref:Histone-binding protein RBBP4-like N-terminal domain-containing protein n=1 Tax=Blastocystis hominis TaxID=12968 RepID=D8M5Z4_BLAHO|nr:uncharacterized protein [Blastocystis hominis]CBK23593.2 unnamed protein product [Blastocystis hominis]|eukprot:XP_012897641.1 uncharacterized protein [Blastocystis hominis]
MIHSLEWPSLTVEWLPECEEFKDEGYSLHHLYLATHTSDNFPNSILKVSIQLQNDITLKEGDEIAEFPSDGISGKLKIEQRIYHDGDVNKMRFMPQNPAIVATKTSSGIVNIFDTQTFPALPPSESIHKTLELTGHEAEGYGLDWSRLQNGYLASGSDDCKICCWDIRGSTAPLRSYARSCVVEDVNWHPVQSHVLAAVGDDGFLGFYDLRQADPASLTPVHAKDCNVVRFNPHFPRLFVTASSDTSVKLWDERNLRFPYHVLEGHTGAVFAGEWSPMRGNVLATAGLDRRVIVWDLERKIGEEQTAEEAEDGPAELLFIHGGHTSKVNDLAWNPNRDWALASVADDNILQVWEMADSVHNGKKYDVGNLDEALLD